MADIDAVVELLERWRDASGVGRLRIGIDASRVIAQLPADRKRALAVEVAERVAPQLVPAIESETGDLSSEQVGALVDLIRRADAQQLDDLVYALKSGDVSAGIELVDDVVDVVAPGDDGVDHLLEDIAEPDEEPEVAAPAPPAPSPAPGDVVVVDDEGHVEVDEAAIRARLEAEAAERAARFRDTSRDTPRAPAYRAPDMDFTTDLDLPDPTVEEVAPLEERRDELPGQSAAVTATVAAAPVARVERPALRRGPVTAVSAAITATPDGYRRRRAAVAAIREGRLGRDDVAGVVASMERATDRTWVAGAALDADLIGPGDLDDLALPPTAAARLRRRTE